MLSVTVATHELAKAAPDTATPGTPDAAAPDAPSAPATGEEPDSYDWSSAEVTVSEPQTRQFVTLYQALRGFDDLAVQERVRCPRLCFAGSADEIVYGERWGDVRVDIAGPIVSRRAELESLGWDVRVLDGLDHTQAMQAAQVLPILRPWLVSRVDGG
nr:hypothetical protein GCM10020093_105210 [Planobispora longispora]